LCEINFTIAQHGIFLDGIVRCRADVVPESAQCQFRGFDAASQSWSAFQHETTKARLRQIRGGDQAVVARSGNDNIETIGSSGLSLEIESVESERRQGRSLLQIHAA
jgi:hypothetical protein